MKKQKQTKTTHIYSNESYMMGICVESTYFV